MRYKDCKLRIQPISHPSEYLILIRAEVGYSLLRYWINLYELPNKALLDTPIDLFLVLSASRPASRSCGIEKEPLTPLKIDTFRGVFYATLGGQCQKKKWDSLTKGKGNSKWSRRRTFTPAATATQQARTNSGLRFCPCKQQCGSDHQELTHTISKG